MRLIGNLSDQQNAESFAAYLLTEGIVAQVEQDGTEYSVWIKEEDNVPRAVKELEAFQSDPGNRKYAESVPKARKIQDEEIRKRQRMSKNIVKVSGGQLPKNRPLTVCLMVVCGLVALLTQFGAKSSQTKATFRALAFNSVPQSVGEAVIVKHQGNRDALEVRMASITRGEVWRLITPIFLHFGVFHLVFNMYWLFLLGSQIEHRYGSFWYGLLILAGAAFPNLLQCIVPDEIGGLGPGFLGGYLTTYLGGMSGVNYALLGFIMIRMYDRSSGLFVQQSTLFLLLGWLVFCMTPIASEMLDLHVANWAHGIGLVVGVIAGYWPNLVGAKK